MAQWWSSLGSTMAIFAFLRAFLPPRSASQLSRLCRKLLAFFSSYVYTTLPEFEGESANELFSSVQLYLSASTTTAASTKCINAALPKNSAKLLFSIGDQDYIEDSYKGVNLRWQFTSKREQARSTSNNNGGRQRGGGSQKKEDEEENRSFVLRVHRRHRTTFLHNYLDHITETAKKIKRQNEERSLYTNINSSSGSRDKVWVSVPFKHPASFQTLALDSNLKRSIIDDLTEFAKGEEFYKRAGRAWKRGYLLYGPPGTGKTSMIAAIANFMGYDVYDLELTQVKTNAELRELLLNTEDKSVIVIEDIDCSLDISERETTVEESAADNWRRRSGGDEGKSGVTLSGLLNFTDGIWSCCSRERIVVFTTNHVEKLDPALLRPGRMDMHISLSFCTFDGVLVLARNYLRIEEHRLFPAIEAAINAAGAKMTPADVSEVLTMHRRDPDAALRALLEALEEKKKDPPLNSLKEEEELEIEEIEIIEKRKEEGKGKGRGIRNRRRVGEYGPVFVA